jgi:hypothetical protein
MTAPLVIIEVIYDCLLMTPQIPLSKLDTVGKPSVLSAGIITETHQRNVLSLLVQRCRSGFWAGCWYHLNRHRSFA